ncbi:Tat pathway signal sequence domain protein [Streptomyces sp. NBC_01298]|uniref:Tat pathway signal sequence domain protein n=1 Tax=Streptomyces sp. NBC_01298 TaxID=2903817 RepID=UPI002E0FF7EB|nr:Tat pathway signal sequence domain protein [Streptomyces sp. NBC_01298]
MSGGIGPIEPGEGTRPLDGADGHDEPDGADGADEQGGHGDPSDPRGPRPGPRTPPAVRRVREAYEGHRRAVLALGAVTCASAVIAGGAALYAHRPRLAPYRPPAPSQLFSLVYLGPDDEEPAQEPAQGPSQEPSQDRSGTAFAFTVRVRASAGPAVTLERLTQSSRALTIEVRPPLPATLDPGEARDLAVRIRVTDCVHVARNSGLPFLEVTLSNGFEKEDHSYIPGDRYARDLSTALTRACPEDRDGSTPPPS